MKLVLTTCLALWVSACGDGGQGSRDFPAGNPSPAKNQSQTPQRPSDTVPQRPSDTVPPLSSQAPATNSQQPPSNAQSAGSGDMCTEVLAAAQKIGCQVPASLATDCQLYTASGSPCVQQVQTWLSCLLRDGSCTADGELANTACPDQQKAALDCIGSMGNPPPPGQTCKPASGCQNCSDTCAICRCGAENNPALVPTCDSLCANG